MGEFGVIVRRTSVTKRYAPVMTKRSLDIDALHGEKSGAPSPAYTVSHGVLSTRSTHWQGRAVEAASLDDARAIAETWFRDDEHVRVVSLGQAGKVVGLWGRTVNDGQLIFADLARGTVDGETGQAWISYLRVDRLLQRTAYWFGSAPLAQCYERATDTIRNGPPNLALAQVVPVRPPDAGQLAVWFNVGRNGIPEVKDTQLGPPLPGPKANPPAIG